MIRNRVAFHQKGLVTFSALIFFLVSLAAADPVVPQCLGDWPLTDSISVTAGSLSLSVYSNGVPVSPSGFQGEDGMLLDGQVLFAVPSLSEAQGFSVCGWINPSQMESGWSSTSPHTIFRLYDSVSTAQFILRILDGELSGYHAIPSGNITLNSSMESNQWSFVAVVCDGDTLTFYLNDQPAQVVSKTCRNEYNRFLIGATNADGTRPFFGNLKRVKLYEGALDEDAVRALYAQEKAMKIGDWPLAESVTNLAGSLSFNVYSNGVMAEPSGFCGADGMVLSEQMLYAVPSVSELRGVTLCGWINPTEMFAGWSSNAPHTVFRMYDSADSNNSQLMLQVLDGNLHGYHSRPSDHINMTCPLDTNRWSFVAVVCDGQSVSFYHDGILQQSVTTACTNSYNRFLVGAFNADSYRGLVGSVKQIKLYDGALDEAAILAVYEEEKSLKIGDWPLLGSVTNLAGDLGLTAYYDGASMDPSGFLETDGMMLSGVSLLAVPSVSERRGISVCGWVSPVQLEFGWSSNAPSTIFRLYNSMSSDQFSLRILDGKLNGYHAAPSENIWPESPLTLNQWTFVAVVCDGESYAIYQDNLPPYIFSISSANVYDRLLIGALRIDGYRPFDGKMRMVKFFDGALSEQAVREIYLKEKPSALQLSGNLLSGGSFENATFEELDTTWSFYPTNTWRIDDRQVVDGSHSLAVTAGEGTASARITLPLSTRSAGEVVFGGWISVKDSEDSRYALARIKCTAEPAGPPTTSFFVSSEPDYYEEIREFRAHTQPTYFEHRLTVPVSYKSLTLTMLVDADVGEFYFDHVFVAEGTNFVANWSVETITNASPTVWRAEDRAYRVSVGVSASADQDVVWVDLDVARMLLAFGERKPIDRGGVEVWAIGGYKAEKLDAAYDDALPTLEDHYQQNGLVRWRSRDWAERYEIYFTPVAASGEPVEPYPVALGAGEMLSYDPETVSAAWGGWPGSKIEVLDADNDGDWDLYMGDSASGYYICRNVGSNSMPFFAPRSRLLPTDQAQTSVRTQIWMDWENDGDNDLIRGVKEPLGTYIDGALLHLAFGPNVGAGMGPTVQVVDESGSEIEFSDATWFRIDAGDFDNDGTNDLVVGTAMGTLDLLLNRGFNGSGDAVVEHVQVPFGLYSSELYESGDMSLKPFVVDWDDDGDDDIVYTAWQGYFFLLLNQGQSGTVAFSDVEQFAQYGGHLSTGDSPTPHVVDWDDDGDLDLLSGSVSGHINYFENTGGRTNPVFGVGGVELTNNLGDSIYITAKGETPIQGPAETMWGYLSCESWDVDQDNDLDLIINDALGRLRWIENVGTRSSPVLSSQIHNFTYGGSAVVTPWRNRPGVTDLNGDGLVELFALDSAGDLVLYHQSTGTPSVLSSVEKMPSPTASTISINSFSGGPGGRSNIDAGDFDGDGDIDLLIARSRNHIDANYIYCKNVGSNSSPVFDVDLLAARDGTFTEWAGSGGHEAWHIGSPEMVDWDGDGDLDLVAGVESGRFVLYHLDYFTGNEFPEAKLISIEQKAGSQTKEILLDGSRILMQEVGVQNTPLQHLY